MILYGIMLLKVSNTDSIIIILNFWWSIDIEIFLLFSQNIEYRFISTF